MELEPTTVLETLLAGGEKHARKTLLELHEPGLTGFYHLVAPEGGRDAIIAWSWKDGFEKQMCMRMVRETARQMRAIAALAVHEAWMLKLDAPTPWHAKRIMANLPRAAESPDRIEVVQLVATDGRDTIGRTLQMVRSRPGGSVIALVADEFMRGGTVSGVLVDGLIARPAS